jgi:aminoglycoside phosphotransferase (APT) family kinase protein
MTTRAATEIDALVECLEPSLGAIAHVHRERSSFESSYGAEVVTVELASGERTRLFLKDFGRTAFRKDDATGRRERELHVYRDLLPDMGLGTAHYHGSLWDEAQGRFWLLLEFVEGEEVRYRPLEDWIAAAGWVGRLHGTGGLPGAAGSPLLIRHDEEYFHRRAELALRDVALFGPHLSGRLERVLRSYGPVVASMASLPRCLVHGTYRAANVIRAAGEAGPRICPLDWELAALGSPLHDLATFVDGFEPPELDRLLDAYAHEARAHGAASPAGRELRQAIDCFRLHRVVNNLSRSERSGYAEADVAKLVKRAETIAEGLAAAGAKRHGAAPDLPADLLPAGARLVASERLKENVHRLRLEVGGAPRSLVVKRTDPATARRCRLVAERWLPAVGLGDLCGPLLGAAATRDGEGVWLLHEYVPGRPLATDPPVRAEVEAAIEAIARVHVAFAGHPLLPECRALGGDRGMNFYSAGLRDARIALRTVTAPDALMERLSRLERQEPERAAALAAAGGPETLVHGDLWPTNAIVRTDGEAVGVRFVDWDEAAVGPAGFDLSTLLLRFDVSHRPWMLDAYRRAVGRLAGWDLPSDRDLNVVFETVAQARLLSLLVWSIAAAAESDPGWLPERLESIVEWLDEVEPVLP